MTKTLTKHGNSLALVIDRSVLDLLGIDAETPLDITTDGKVLVVSPSRGGQRKRRFATALSKANRRYGKMLKRLA